MRCVDLKVQYFLGGTPQYKEIVVVDGLIS